MPISMQRLSFDKVNDEVFLRAYKIRDINKARILNRAEKKKIPSGSPDILVRPFIGKGRLMSRQEVVSNYRYLTDKEINVRGWKSENTYIIYRIVREPVAIMQVPININIDVNGKTANKGNRQSGDYIICSLDENGNILRNTARVISSAMFKKICYIPPSEIIERYKGRHNQYFDLNTGSAMNYDQATGKQPIRNTRNTNGGHVARIIRHPIINRAIRPQVGRQQPERKSTTLQNREQVSTSQARPQLRMRPLRGSQANKKYKLNKQIHNAQGERVGFEIIDSNGNTQLISLGEAMQLAGDSKIGNVELVRNSSGNSFLRGNGISIDNLPIIIK